MSKQQPEPLRFLPSVADWAEADAPAAELTERIMRGMDCVNPAKFERHVKATIAAYLAQEAAERRGYAERAFTSPRRADVHHTQADEDETPEHFFRTRPTN